MNHDLQKEIVGGLESALAVFKQRHGDHAAMVVMRLEQAIELILTERDSRQMGIQLCVAHDTIRRLCGLVRHANKDAFSNGVVSEQGQDEGETIASSILSDAERQLNAFIARPAQ